MYEDWGETSSETTSILNSALYISIVARVANANPMMAGMSLGVGTDHLTSHEASVMLEGR